MKFQPSRKHGIRDVIFTVAAICTLPAVALAQDDEVRGKVQGIGGVFFKVDDVDSVNAWYKEHLGIDASGAGFTFFMWRNHEEASNEHRTVWAPYPKSSDYFGKPEQQIMINYIVDDLDAILEGLERQGVTKVGDIEEYDYGRFGWILDVEGNKVELWEPKDPG